MRAHQIMTRSVVTVRPDATILEAANTMLQHHVSGLPVVDAAGKLVGIVSEGDFIRRGEIGTQKKQELLGFGAAFTDAACYNLKDLSAEARSKLFQNLFFQFIN